METFERVLIVFGVVLVIVLALVLPQFFKSKTHRDQQIKDELDREKDHHDPT